MAKTDWAEIVKPGAKTRKPRRGLRRFLLVITMLFAVTSLMATGLYAYVSIKLKSTHAEILVEDRTSGPMNVVVVGSDTREVLTAEERRTFGRLGGRRADTIMLVHLNDSRDKAVVVSFPRDLRVKLPSGKLGKINASYGEGPNGVVKTVQEFSGLPIHHYVEVNFVGFRKIVDTLGGVDVFFERAVKDQDSGLNVPKGCVHLAGNQALAFVRVRKIDNDFQRIARQQLFMRLMLDKVISAGTLLNPVRVIKLVNSVSENLTTDSQLSVKEMSTLAWTLRNFDAKRVDMRQVPSICCPSIGGASYVVANEDQSTSLFDALAQGDALPDFGRTGVSPIAPRDVRVTVLNGTDELGIAKQQSDALIKKGFDVRATGDAEGGVAKKTIVYYKEGNEDKAKELAKLYSASVKRLRTTTVAEVDVVLVLGEDFVKGSATPAPAESGSAIKPLARAC